MNSCVHCLTKEKVTPDSLWGKDRTPDAVLMFLLGKLGSYILVDFSFTTNLITVAVHTHPLIAMKFPNGSGLFKRITQPTVEKRMNGVRNMTKSSLCCLDLHIPQILILSSTCGIINKSNQLALKTSTD